MKPVRSHDPARWRERDVEAHTIEARAAVLVDGARPVQPLAAPAVARIRADILEEGTNRRRFFDVRRPMIVRLAAGLALVLICAATADGAGILWRRHLRKLQPSGRPAAPPGVAAPRQVHRTAASNDAPVPAAVPTPAPDEVATDQASRHVAARARTSVSTEPAIAAPSPSTALEPPRLEVPNPQPVRATEADMVASALSQLRQQGDPRAALATLDAYAQAFPHGVLETEARRTRVEAVLRLGDRNVALGLLDGMPGLSNEPGTDLLLTRAELRAAAGRFREALADFTDAVEGEGGVTAASERALYGRAVCFGRLADDARARADLLVYGQRFPSGRFAAEVRRLLSAPAPHP
jgi:hypothetical protein